MNHLKLFVMALILTCLLLPSTALAFQYISATELKTAIESETPLTLVDIQVKRDFDRHHIVGAIPTYAFPVRSNRDRAKLDPVITQAAQDDSKIVIICPRGLNGAMNTFEYLLDSGIAEDRVFILADGQAAWPYPELLANNN